MNGERPSDKGRSTRRAESVDNAAGLVRLGESDGFGAEVLRLAALAPEPWASQLRALVVAPIAERAAA